MGIVEKEKEWHNQRFSKDEDTRSGLGRYYKVTKNAKDYRDSLLINLVHEKNSKLLLEYGCGTGGNLEFFNDFGFKVSGIDISEEGVKKANQKSVEKQIDAHYYVMDAQKTDFENASFDVVVGNGIVHHLNIEASMKEISRILKDRGVAIFFEPMGHNPFINLFRKLTPKMRTEDEHPLVISDFEIMKKYFNVEIKYFCFFSIAAAAFSNSFLFKYIYGITEFIDRAIFAILPILKKYSWIAIIKLTKKGA